MLKRSGGGHLYLIPDPEGKSFIISLRSLDACWRGFVNVLQIKEATSYSQFLRIFIQLEWWVLSHTLSLHCLFSGKMAVRMTHSLRCDLWGFPDGSVVKNPGNTGSIPGPRRSHVPWSNWTSCSWAREPQLLSPRAVASETLVPRAHAPPQEKPVQREARPR